MIALRHEGLPRPSWRAVGHDQAYRALAFATNDAHGTLDVMLSASNPDVDRRALQQQYGLTEVQALAVMDMQFRRVTEMDNIALSAQSSAPSPFVSSGAR